MCDVEKYAITGFFVGSVFVATVIGLISAVCWSTAPRASRAVQFLAGYVLCAGLFTFLGALWRCS